MGIPEHLSSGRVKVIDFWYGDVSQQQKFFMQWGQEHHCVYWGKGRAKWIAHMDIDEFIQPMIHQTLPQFLSGIDHDQYDGVSIRMAFWDFVDYEKALGE